MQDHHIFQEQIDEQIKQRPWLFTDRPFVPFDEYFAFFKRHYAQGEIVPLMTPGFYSKDVFDEHKEQVVCTASLSNADGSRNMVTLLQFAPTQHVVATLNYNADIKQIGYSLAVYGFTGKEAQELYTKFDNFRVSPENGARKSGF